MQPEVAKYLVQTKPEVFVMDWYVLSAFLKALACSHVFFTVLFVQFAKHGRGHSHKSRASDLETAP